MKKILALVLASLMLVACFAGCGKEEKTETPVVDEVVSAADTASSTDVVEDTADDTADAPVADAEYDVLIAFGGDAAAENDWGFQYYGDGAASNAGEITATNGKVKVGETVTVKLDFAAPVFNTWFFAPCLIVGEPNKTVDATVVCRIDGNEVAIDLAADPEGKTFWYEGTGDYSAEQCVRLAGGWNEWAVKFIDEPAGFTSLEYDITLNSVA